MAPLTQVSSPASSPTSSASGDRSHLLALMTIGSSWPKLLVLHNHLALDDGT
jgi:hypothetical protein